MIIILTFINMNGIGYSNGNINKDYININNKTNFFVDKENINTTNNVNIDNNDINIGNNKGS